MSTAEIVDIVGRACRLPGAADCAQLWHVLTQGRCTVTEIGEDRWAKARYYHPRPGERGKSYTFAAGVVDDIWGFDPGVLGISPREAEQMDPQQRLLLQVVWEALEDAGARPSTLAGAQVGVYVGVSGVDSATRRSHDGAVSDAFTMTGSTLSLVANRISHAFDWQGPSLSIDTACSSSLVALAQALAALREGLIDTAVVGGVNVLLSPFPFLGFSAARMLAPDGRCRPFDAAGHGYVRAEGAVALILRRRAAGALGVGRRYGEVVAAGVNSDGRTSGISLPSAAQQAALLQQVYRRYGLSPDDLAFVEAHGTGTAAGDPAEAEAIGRVLGQPRSRPLPIGSIKSNIGHLEPAAGLAGVLKALLALEHGELPASIHFTAPNPAIDLAALNLEVAAVAQRLQPRRGGWLAGVSSFGFGGTNAHVVLRQATPPATAAPAPAAGEAPVGRAGVLMLSAHCGNGLSALAAAWRPQLAAARPEELAGLAAAAAQTREHLAERLVLPATSSAEAIAALDAFLAAAPDGGGSSGQAVARAADVGFVYAGNGAQWAGMGRLAHAANPRFRARFDALSRHFADLAGWSLTEALLLDDLAERIASASIAQPLLFAIQAALSDALADIGLSPSVVAGHSVGEIAAAYTAGILDEGQALRVIAARSAAQEQARGLGTMAALGLPEDDARALLAACGGDEVEIGAINSPRSVTLTGRRDAVSRVVAAAAAAGHRVKPLDLDYPFHSALLEPTRRPLLAALDKLTPHDGRVVFVSSVTGAVASGRQLDAAYWWRNVRSPVRFADAIAGVLAHGARVIVEISPRAILQGYLRECLGERSAGEVALVASLGSRDAPSVDPVRATLARALSRGARVDLERAFGSAAAHVRLPHYPWQNRTLHATPTVEAGSAMQAAAVEHPLLGWRERAGLAEWFNHLDAGTFPTLADHRVGGQVYVPGAVLAEIAMAAARRWLQADRAELYDFDIVAPLVLAADHLREVQTRIEPTSRSLTIASRRRLSDESWQVHVEARFGAPAEPPCPAPEAITAAAVDLGAGLFDAAAFYAEVAGLGLDYGPRLQRLAGIGRAREGDLVVEIATARDSDVGCGELDPIGLDIAFHGLLAALLDQAREAGEPAPLGHVPIRLGRLRCLRPGAAARRAVLSGLRRGPTTARCDVLLLDADGAVIAEVSGARFRAGRLVQERPLPELTYGTRIDWLPLPGATAAQPGLPTPRELLATPAGAPEPAAVDEEARLLVEAAARRAAVDILRPLAQGDNTPAALVASSRIAPWLQQPLGRLIGDLAAVGLIERAAAGWCLTAAADALPPLDAILQTVIGEHPTWWADCALIAEAARSWPQYLADADAAEPPRPPFQATTLEAFAAAGPRTQALVEPVLARVGGIIAHVAATGRRQPLRVVEIGAGAGALTRPLARLLAAHGGRLLAVEAAPAGLARLRTHLAASPAVSITSAADLAAAAAAFGAIDVVVTADGLGRGEPMQALIERMAEQLADDAVLVATMARRETVHTLVRGLAPASQPQQPAGDAEAWRAALAAAGCRDLGSEPQSGGATLLVGRLQPHRPLAVTAADDATPPRRLTIVRGRGIDGAAADAVASALTTAGLPCQTAAMPLEAGAGPLELVLLLPAAATASADTSVMSRRLGLLSGLLRQHGAQLRRLWVVAPGALRDQAALGAACPVAAGIAAFLRTVANEHAATDVRLIDVAADLTADAMAARLAALILAPGTESEMVIADDGLAVPRIARGLPMRGANPARPPAGIAPTEATGTRLAMTAGAARDRLVWRRCARRAPDPGEVEIEVAATGLNFRDCMWSMGLLPEEALEDGFAGPTLGFECAGRVLRLGAGVADLRPGDPVVAFAPAAFASHVTVAADTLAPIPAGLDPVAAATVPVAFITASYALEHLARLAAGETVLIHGGAGGVGLAALQIARHLGARVIATAGSAEKRSLLRMLGAEHALDSRSLAFADEVMAVTAGSGVDVVLNSLAGEAMERSLALVRPFGRFIELGKRDFYGATKIGLRPFRRNVSYFGVDADQLLAARPQLARTLFADLARRLGDGSFLPLPYRRFPAAEVADAFRLMQSSGHVGKIVVCPPAVAEVAATPEAARFAADPAGAHVVLGGTGGFGLATAQWLAERGARHLVLASRRGCPDAAGEAAIAHLRAAGITVDVAACDITSETALAALLEDIRSRLPIRGVVHAAMQLDDDVIAHLDRSRIARVLAPKVTGAGLLDRLTRQDRLQYFVLYSSVTAMIGNPGQAAYVAANGYLDSLARRRRAEGLVALSVGWGGIADAGYLARHDDVARAIERRTGAAAMPAAQALSALGELLAADGGAPASVVVSAMSWGAAGGQLPLLRRPMFRDLLAAEGDAVEAPATAADLAAAVRASNEGGARALVLAHLSAEVARIFRMALPDVRPARTLSELGMDSLMGLELRVAVQQRLGTDIPLTMIAGNQSLEEIAARLAAMLRAGDGAREPAGGVAADLARQHVAGDIDGETLDRLSRQIDRREAARHGAGKGARQ